ncbi:MAG TPA: glycosyltransferase family 4 protein [Solirubrobacteraceae bacterium]|jgi:glycosyltransferase involved in cell wall biosynthesis
MKVLYVSHTAVVSGAERSLIDLVDALGQSVEPLLATPDGRLQELAREHGIATTPLTGTAGSLRLHPLHTPRALVEMALTARQVRRAVTKAGSQLVHANSIRAGLVLALARLRDTPTVVHVRDCLPPGRVSDATLRLVAGSATTVVANSRYTADSVLAAAPRTHVEVVHNAVDLARFDPSRIDRAAARARLDDALGIGDRPLLGVVAQVTPWKGQETAIQALALLREQGVDADLLLVGSAKFVAASTRFANEDYVARLRALVASSALEDRVHWLGEREDVPEIMAALDVLLLPSWEEPFGRAVVEAMAMRVPVVATSVGGPREIVDDGREGRLVAPRDPRAWAAAIRTVLDSPQRRGAMGLAGRERVERDFTFEQQARTMIQVYRQAAGDLAKAGDHP